MPELSFRLRYQSLTGPRTVEVLPVKQLGRIRWQVLANDARLDFAGTFFPAPRRAVEVVEETLVKRYGEAALLEWRITDRAGERAIERAELAELLRRGQ